jgi:hypothetical protein
MKRSKLVIILCLLAVPLLALGPMVGGQGYVTQTITTMVTNQATSVAMGTSIVTSIMPQSRVIFSAPVQIPPTHGVCGIYFVHPFNATSDDSVSGTLTADNQVDFYILTDAAYQSWTHQVVAGGNCTPGNIVLFQKGTISYNFTSAIPATGLYQIVVNNLSHSTVNAQLTVNLIANAPATATMVTYSTMTEANVQTLTLITLETSQPQGTTSDMLTPLAVVALIIVAVAAIMYKVKKRK